MVPKAEVKNSRDAVMFAMGEQLVGGVAGLMITGPSWAREEVKKVTSALAASKGWLMRPHIFRKSEVHNCCIYSPLIEQCNRLKLVVAILAGFCQNEFREKP